MKLVVTLVGIILILLGVAGFSAKYLSYTTTEKVVEVGNLKLTAEQEKVLFISPVASAIMLVSGVVLIIFGVRK